MKQQSKIQYINLVEGAKIQAETLVETLQVNELDSVKDTYKLIQKENINIDEKIFELENMLRIFDESKYLRKTEPKTIPGTMGLRRIDLSPRDGEPLNEPITLKVYGFAIRATSITLTALKSLPKDDEANTTTVQAQEAKLVQNLINYHKALANPEVLSKFLETDNEDQQKEATQFAHNGLYALINDQAKALNHKVTADPLYKRINLSKFELKSKEENELKKRRKALMSSDDCQLLTRPQVHARVTSKGITTIQTFTPVAHMTTKQKASWRQVAEITACSDEDIKKRDSDNSTKLKNFCDDLKQSGNKKEAKELQKLHKEKKNFNTFKEAVKAADSKKISQDTKDKINMLIQTIEPSWFTNFPEQFRQEYITMAKDAVQLEKLFTEYKPYFKSTTDQKTKNIVAQSHMQKFKHEVAQSSVISTRMKLRIARDLDSIEAFEKFDPFFVLAQSASSGNRCSPQASNLVGVETITVKEGMIIRKDTSYTRSNENMLADARYNKDSNYEPGGADRSPFWEQGDFSKRIAKLFQSTPDHEDAKSLVDCAVMTLEQIYHKHLIEKDKSNKGDLIKGLEGKYASHWGLPEKTGGSPPEYSANFQIKNKSTGETKPMPFAHKPILFSSSLLSTLPGPIENSFITRKAPDRNRMMFFQKLAAFDTLRTNGDIYGTMITMNFAVNDYRKRALMGFSNVIDKHNKHAAADLTLAVLNNLIVATAINDEVRTGSAKLGISTDLFEIYDNIENDVRIGNRDDLDKVSKQLITKMETVSYKLEDKTGKAANNTKLAVAATTEFIRLFQDRATPKSANEQIMLACYANLMVQSSSGEASQTDQHCKSGRDRTYTTQIHEKAMQTYFEKYGKLPTPDDSGKSIEEPVLNRKGEQLFKIMLDSKGEIVFDSEGQVVFEPIVESILDKDGKPLDAREKFIEIYADEFFSGLGQENSNQNQHGSFGLQNLGLRREWPLCLVFGTVNPDDTCMLPKDIQEKLKERDAGLKNNGDLRNLGKMGKEMKDKENAFVKTAKTSSSFIRQLLMSPLAAVGLTMLAVITSVFLFSKIMPKAISKDERFKYFMAASTSMGLNMLSLLKPIILLALSPLILLAPPFLLCCKITGKAAPSWDPLFTGTLLFLALAGVAVAAAYLAPAVILAATVVQVTIALSASLLYIFGAQGLDPDKSVQTRSLDMSITILIAVAITSMVIFSPALSLALPVIVIPIIAAIAAIPIYKLIDKVVTKISEAVMPESQNEVESAAKMNEAHVDETLSNTNDHTISNYLTSSVSSDNLNKSTGMIVGNLDDSTERYSDNMMSESRQNSEDSRISEDNSDLMAAIFKNGGKPELALTEDQDKGSQTAADSKPLSIGMN